MAGDGPGSGNALRTLTAAAAAALVALALTACGGSSKPTAAGRSTTSTATASHSATGSAAPGRRVRTVLVLTQTLGYHHASIPTAKAALRRIAARDGRYRLVFLPSATKLTPQALAHASAVVFLLTTGTLPMTPTDKRALVAFVHRRRRAGRVSLGHRYVSPLARLHQHDRRGVQPSPAPEHAAGDRRRPLDADDPRRSRRRSGSTRSSTCSRTIRCRACTCWRGSTACVHHPLVWCRRAERGRVFYDALGHFAQTWSNPLSDRDGDRWDRLGDRAGERAELWLSAGAGRSGRRGDELGLR